MPSSPGAFFWLKLSIVCFISSGVNSTSSSVCMGSSIVICALDCYMYTGLLHVHWIVICALDCYMCTGFMYLGIEISGGML